jgi:hypothetical protein
VFPWLRDVHVIFGIFFRCFTQKHLYLFHSGTPPPPPTKLLIQPLWGVFRKLLSPCSLKCPQTPLVCQQIYLPISFGRVGFISFEVIDILSWELDSCYPYHHFKIFSIISSIFIRGDRAKQYKFDLIPSPLEINVKASLYSGNVVCTPF